MKFNITLPDSTTGLSVSFNTGYVSALGNAMYEFTGTLAGAPIVLSIGGLGSAIVYVYADYLPSPNPDDSDDGKVLTVNKNKWEMKTPTGGGSADAVLYTPQTLTDEQKKQARENVDAASDFVINATTNDSGTVTVDKTFAQIREAINTGKRALMRIGGDNYGNEMQLVSYTENTFVFGVMITGPGRLDYYEVSLYASDLPVTVNGSILLRMNDDGTMPQCSMASAPTKDMEIATKKYVDDNKGSADVVLYTKQTLTDPQKFQARKNIDAADVDSPQFKGYVTLTPATESEGIGVGLFPSKDGNNFALDISDVNESTPTKLTGVKTPADADTNAAATVEYVINKAKKKVWIDVDAEEVKTFNYADIDNEITNGGGNVWLSLGAEQLRMVACNKAGASSYELTFVNLSGTGFNIHTVTVSASAAEYAVIAK